MMSGSLKLLRWAAAAVAFLFVSGPGIDLVGVALHDRVRRFPLAGQGVVQRLDQFDALDRHAAPRFTLRQAPTSGRASPKFSRSVAPRYSL